MTICLKTFLVSLLQKYSIHGSTSSPRTEYQYVTNLSVRPELVEGLFARGSGVIVLQRHLWVKGSPSTYADIHKFQFRGPGMSFRTSMLFISLGVALFQFRGPGMSFRTVDSKADSVVIVSVPRPRNVLSDPCVATSCF